MMHVATPRRLPGLLFGGLAAIVYAASMTLARRLPSLGHPDIVAVGMTLDLVVVVPLAFYLLVVRRRGWPVVATVPVFVLSIVAAARIIPATHQQPLRVAELLAIPAELLVLAWIAWRAHGALKAARCFREADPLQVLQRAAIDLVRQSRVAGVLATEIAVLYYGFFSWRARPHAPERASAFTHHRRSGHMAVVCAFVMVMAIEGLAIHLMLALWSGVAAWLLTVTTAYGALWFLADARATVLRPLLVDEESLLLRAGLRWTLRVPRDEVAAIRHAKPVYGRESLNLTLLGAPTHWIELAAPMLAEGPYGMRRRVRAIGVQPDAAEEFGRALAAPDPSSCRPPGA
jgi:hypothetical protein